MDVKDRLLIACIVIFPFNLIIGRIIPETVSLPLYVVDIILLLIGIFVLIDWKKIKKSHVWIVAGFALFLLWCSVSIILHWHELITELSTNDATYEMFKRILSANVLHSINKTFHLFLAFILLIAIVQSSLEKQKLLKYACIPLFILFKLEISEVNSFIYLSSKRYQFTDEKNSGIGPYIYIGEKIEKIKN